MMRPNNPFGNFFVGREDVVFQLMQRLRSRKEGGIYELTGMAGIGKTTIAQQIAQRALEENLFPDGIIWIWCREHRNLSDLMKEIGRALGSKLPSHSSVVEYVATHSILIIFDGLDEIEYNDEIISFIQRYLVRYKVHVITTSRVPLQIFGHFPHQTFQLDVLTQTEVTEFLKRVPKIANIPPGEIMEITGGLPLALQMIAQLIQEDFSLDEIKVRLQNEIENRFSFANTVFISYAWGGDSERVVDELDRAFSKRGILLTRDKKDLDYKGYLESFGERITRGQCAILVISDKYLRSEHCMSELVELANNRNLREYVFPIVLSDAHIYKAVDRLNYIKYWDDRIDQLNTAIRGVDGPTNLAGLTADLDKYARIRAVFDNLTGLLSDMNTLTPEVYDADRFSSLVNVVEERISKKRIASQADAVSKNVARYLQRPDPSVLRQQALKHIEAGRLEEAILELEAIKLIDGITDQPTFFATVLSDLGVAYFQLKRFDDAQIALQESLDISHGSGEKGIEVTTLGNLGELHLSQAQYGPAEQFFLSALELSNQLGLQAYRATIMNRLAEIRRVLGDLSTAMAYANEALRLAEQLDGRAEIAKSSIIIGDCRKELRRYQDAIYLYNRALQIYSEDNQTHPIALLHLKLAEVYEAIYEEQNQLDALEAAIRDYEHARSKADEIKQTDTSIIAQIQQGGLYVKAYRQSGEQKYYENALTILNSLEKKLANNEVLQPLVQENLGQAHYSRYEHTKDDSDLVQAEQYLQSAFDYAVSKDNLAKWLVITPILSAIYFELKQKANWNNIWGFGSQSIKSVSRNADSKYLEKVASVMGNSIQIAVKKGDSKAAFQQLVEISDYFQNSGLKMPGSIQSVWNDLRNQLGEEKFALIYAQVEGKLTSGMAALLEEARTLMGNNQFESAAQKLSEALAHLVDDAKEDSRRQKATILFLRGICLREQQLWEIALKDQETAFELYANLKDLDGQAHALLEIGFLYEFMNSYEDARLHYTDAYRLYKKVTNKSGMANAVEHLGTLEFRVRMYAQAVENLEEAHRLYAELGERDKASRLENDLIDAKAGLKQQGSN